MEGFRAEPTTKLLSEMEGFPHVWNDETGKMGIRIQRNLIPDYATDDFWEAVNMWNEWKATRLPPDAGGSLDQPCLWTDIIRLMESCSRSLKAE